LSGQPGRRIQLLSVTGDLPCNDDIDLASAALSTSVAIGCKKNDISNTGSRTSLSALITVESDGCTKSSKIVAIVLPSVIGGVILITLVEVLVWMEMRNKAFKEH
jgi:hypothetical protein